MVINVVGKLFVNVIVEIEVLKCVISINELGEFIFFDVKEGDYMFYIFVFGFVYLYEYM